MSKSIYLTIVILTISIAMLSYSQEVQKPILISPLIGDTLDQRKAEHYRLFQDIVGFHHALFYENPDGSLKAKVSFVNNGIMKDSLIQKYYTLQALTTHIHLIDDKEPFISRTGVLSSQSVSLKNPSILEVEMDDHRIFSGELISVRKKEILISRQETDDKLNIENIYTVPIDKILHVRIPGKSYILSGAGIGLLSGVGLATLFAWVNGNQPGWYGDIGSQVVIGSVIFGPIGLLIGTISGAMSSSSDQDFEYEPGLGYLKMKQYARFPKEEPEFIRNIR